MAGYFASLGRSTPRDIDLLLALLGAVLIYIWYYRDAVERKYARSPVLGGAIILLNVFVLPYYLIRSRRQGERAKAVWRYVGLFVFYITMVMVASSLAEWICLNLASVQ